MAKGHPLTRSTSRVPKDAERNLLMMQCSGKVKESKGAGRQMHIPPRREAR